MEKTSRESLRKMVLGVDHTPVTKIIEVNGQEFEIRQPTIKGRADLRTDLITTDDDGEKSIDPTAFLLWTVIRNTYVPGTDERVFDDEDYEALANTPSGGVVDVIGAAAVELNNVDIPSKKN